MDSFYEQLVVRKNNSKHILKLIAYLLLIFTVPAVLFLLGINDIGTRYFVILSVCAFGFGVYGSYYLVTGLYVEYEYAITNSNITIDKIIAKRSRKRVISVDIKKFNTLRKLKDSDPTHKSYKKVFTAGITENGDDVYAAEMHLEKFGGDCLLLFSPNEKSLNTMKPYLRTNVKAELLKAGAFGKPEKTAEKTLKDYLKKQEPAPTAKKAEESSKYEENKFDSTDGEKENSAASTAQSESKPSGSSKKKKGKKK